MDQGLRLLERTNNSVYGIPLLANPGDPINSSPIYTSRNDWNWQKTFSGRASLLFKPNEKFSAELARSMRTSVAMADRR